MCGGLGKPFLRHISHYNVYSRGYRFLWTEMWILKSDWPVQQPSAKPHVYINSVGLIYIVLFCVCVCTFQKFTFFIFLGSLENKVIIYPAAASLRKPPEPAGHYLHSVERSSSRDLHHQDQEEQREREREWPWISYAVEQRGCYCCEKIKELHSGLYSLEEAGRYGKWFSCDVTFTGVTKHTAGSLKHVHLCFNI